VAEGRGIGLGLPEHEQFIHFPLAGEPNSSKGRGVGLGLPEHEYIHFPWAGELNSSKLSTCIRQKRYYNLVLHGIWVDALSTELRILTNNDVFSISSHQIDLLGYSIGDPTPRYTETGLQCGIPVARQGNFIRVANHGARKGWPDAPFNYQAENMHDTRNFPPVCAHLENFL
jgi:hypothetical protein